MAQLPIIKGALSMKVRWLGHSCITRPAPGRIAFSDGIFPIR